MAPAKKAPALFAQLQRSLETEGDELAAKVKARYFSDLPKMALPLCLSRLTSFQVMCTAGLQHFSVHPITKVAHCACAGAHPLQDRW